MLQAIFFINYCTTNFSPYIFYNGIQPGLRGLIFVTFPLLLALIIYGSNNACIILIAIHYWYYL